MPSSNETENNVGALLYVFENRIGSLKKQIAETSGREEAKLKEELKLLEAQLKAENTEIISVKRAGEVSQEMEIDGGFFERLNGKHVDQVDIKNFLNSPLSNFLTPETLKKLEDSLDSTIFSDKILSIVDGREEWEILDEAEKELAQEIIERERGGSEPLSKRQENEFVRKKRRKLEKENVDNIDLRGKIDQESLEEIENLSNQLENMRRERLRKFMYETFSDIEVDLQFLKEEKFFSKKEEEEYETEVEMIKQSLPEIAKSSSKKIVNAIEGLEQFREGLTKNVAEAVEVNMNPEKVKEEIRELAKVIQSFDPTSDTARHFKAELERSNDMSAEELANLRDELKTFARMRENIPGKNINPELLEGAKEGIKARNCINEIAKCTKSEGVINAVRKTIGLEYLNSLDEIENGNKAMQAKVVPHDEFKKYQDKRYTKGNMVTYKRGDIWYVIMSQNAINEGVDVKELKKQLTHELLQVEFEVGGLMRDKNGKDKKISDAYIEELRKNPTLWSEIQAEFKTWGKTPPKGSEWNEHTIASELYGMQNELGKRKVTNPQSDNDTEKMKLNNLLFAALGGRASSILGMDERNQKYAEANKEEADIIGYEGGMDDSEGGSESGEGGGGGGMESSSHLGNMEDIEALDKKLEELQNHHHISEVDEGASTLALMREYNQNTFKLNDNLRRDPDNTAVQVTVKKRLEEVNKDLGEIEEALDKVSKNAGNSEMGFFAKMWSNTKFHSMADVVQMGRDFYEYMGRRRKRKSAGNAANLGSAFFGKTGFGREAIARGLKAEADEVGEWKSRYENLAATELEGILKDLARSFSPNQDQLKAVMQILADKGRIVWSNQDLWKILNRLQSKVELKIGDKRLLESPTLLSEKLQKAFGAIYDFDEFPTLERNNESSFESEMQKNDTSHKKAATELTGRIGDLLEQHRRGENVDPILYASLIKFCIREGRSTAEVIMYHLMVGIAKGILAPDFGIRLSGDLAGVWPPIDWFNGVKPSTKENFEKICKEKFPRIYEGGYNGDADKEFTNWFWTEVQNDEAVKTRARKTVKDRKWDPDWGRTASSLGDPNTMKAFLAGRSGQSETSTEAASNAFVGLTQWIDENSTNPSRVSRVDFARITANSIMAEGIMKRTAYYKGNNDIATRDSHEMNNQKPPEAYAGRHDTKSLQGHRSHIVSFLEKVDRNGLLSFLQSLGDVESKEDQERGGQECQRIISERYGSLTAKIGVINTIDEVYNNIGAITQHIFESMSTAEYNGILAAHARGL